MFTRNTAPWETIGWFTNRARAIEVAKPYRLTHLVRVTDGDGIYKVSIKPKVG